MRAILFPLTLLASVIEAMLLVMLTLVDLRQHVEGTIALLLGTSVFYLISVFLTLRLTRPVPRLVPLFIVACGVLFRLTVWPIYPAFSDDVFRYRWEGKLQVAGGNPYQVRPNDPEWARLRDSTFPYIVGKDFKAGYGPLSELTEEVWYRITARLDDAPLRQAFWFKLPGAILDLAVSGALIKLLMVRGLPAARAIVYLWSPVPIFEFWCSGHNDTLLLLPLLGAVILGVQNRWIWAYCCLGIAAAAKLWPVLLVPLFVRHTLLRNTSYRRKLISVVAGIGLFAAIPIACFWPYRSNVVENLRFMSGFVGGWRNNDALFGLLLHVARDPNQAKQIAFAILGIAVLAIACLRWPLERAIILTIVAMLLVASNCHPWYLAWFLPLLAVEAWSPLLLWTAVMPLTYAVLIEWIALGVWNGSTAIRWYVYAPVLMYWIACLGFNVRIFKNRKYNRIVNYEAGRDFAGR